MLALLGTTIGKYVAGGAALLIIIGGIALYIMNLRDQVSAAQAQIAAQAATVNELQATNAANLKAISDLRAADAIAQASLSLDALHQQATVQTVATIKEHVTHVAVSNVCRGVDARDLAVTAGVQQLIGSAAADPDGDEKGVPAR